MKIDIGDSTFENQYASAKLVSGDVEPELCWVDFETTGLENQDAVPLEVGVIITDKMCNVRAVFHSLIMERNWQFKLLHAPGVVRDMHEKSGLERQLQDTERMMPAGSSAPWIDVLSAKSVNEQLFDFLHEYGGGENRLPMAGSTINFDRHFMRLWLTHCNDYLHYRNVDVSTLKNLCKMHNPRIYAALPPVEGGTAHRALDDIKGSMQDYLFYLENFLYVA